jgi:XTP/dITP diphosphohydrolase
LYFRYPLWYKKTQKTGEIAKEHAPDRKTENCIMEIVLATRNRKKVEEIKRITEGMPIKVLTIDDFPGCPDVQEDGITFEENAIKKALTVAHYTGKAALADDSGLEVQALGGAPGTLSARYAGDDADDGKNVAKLLREMFMVPEMERGARFVCCIVLAYPGGSIRTFFGYSEGSIGRERKGVNGFGYDPVFYPVGHIRTFAEMNDSEKDALSHRGEALKKFYNYLKNKSY